MQNRREEKKRREEEMRREKKRGEEDKNGKKKPFNRSYSAFTDLKRARLDFFLEISPHQAKKAANGEVTNLQTLFADTTSSILLFFKYYDCKKCEMEYADASHSFSL